MNRDCTVDTSLAERHGIIHLLERLKLDTLSLDDVEAIGSTLQKSGRRALSPLVRRLWRERSSDVISRYAYVLDFFDEGEWMSQLVQIALQRHDLADEGKAVLLAALRGYGVDITAPPFTELLARAGISHDGFLLQLLDRGDEGRLLFMEDFLNCPRDVQLSLVRQLEKGAVPAVVELLEILLWLENEEVAGEAMSVLGRIRSSEAANALAWFLREGHPSLLPRAERSLRRLAFVGIVPDAPLPRPALSFHAAAASPPDASGFRVIWISRWVTTQRAAALYVQIHDTEGIKGGWGTCGSGGELSAQFRDAAEEDGLLTVPVEYALRLLRDALARTDQGGMPLPAAFYVQRPRILAGQDLTPLLHEPSAPTEQSRGGFRRADGDIASLLDEDEFAGWLIASAAVYDYAEEWDRLEARGNRREAERLLDRFCRELVAPDGESLRRRLLLVAEVMEQAGREAEVVALVREAAGSLSTPSRPANPFLRRIATESLVMAKEALAEGFDLRDHLGDEEGDCGE